MPQTTERVKCHVEGNNPVLCPTLSSMVEFGRGKGVRRPQLQDIHTGELTRSMVVLHSGDHAKNGVVMNVCPFCGGDLSSHLMKEAEVGNEPTN